MEECILFSRRDPEAVFFTEEIPKDTVHEADIARMRHLLGDLDRLIHRSRLGDARQKEQLIEGKTKKDPHGRMQLFHLLRGKFPDDPEKVIVFPKDAVDELRQKVRLLSLERVLCKNALEHDIAVGVFFKHVVEHLIGKAARGRYGLSSRMCH